MNRNSVLSMSGLSRRAALGGVGAFAAALGLGSRLGRAAAQEASPDAGGGESDLVFVHGFGSGSLFRA